MEMLKALCTARNEDFLLCPNCVFTRTAALRASALLLYLPEMLYHTL